DGHPEDAPYDRVLATCAVRAVPYAWIEQTAPSGIVLAPWETPWLSHGLLRLTVEGDGTASGWFTPHPACMPLRAHRTDPRILRDVVRDEDQPEETTTGVSPCAVTGDNWNARFAIGLQTRDISHTWQHDPGIDGVTSRLWLTTTDATSRAAIDPDPENPEGPEDGERFTIHQHGPRRLWDEVTAALTWWHQAGSPGPERFGMTVQPDGTHHAWLDTPDRPVPRTG
ncbi:methyltransferase, partial [Streptomyces sp. LP05-1]|nr:methyltransferase [Streptomyces sp. LP05-1]